MVEEDGHDKEDFWKQLGSYVLPGGGIMEALNSIWGGLVCKTSPDKESWKGFRIHDSGEADVACWSLGNRAPCWARGGC